MVRKVPVLARVMRAEEVERDRTRPRASRFAVKPIAIWALLQRELRMVEATDAVCELDAHERFIQKRSGEWYGDTKPRRSLVILTISRAPQAGAGERPPLVFRCGRYHDWQDNVYAIARTLESLRMVERYGCTAGGEQYTGFAALPPPGESSRDTVQAAVDLILEVSGDSSPREGQVHKNNIANAIRRSHPDHGGDAKLLQRVIAARRTLEEAGAVYE